MGTGKTTLGPTEVMLQEVIRVACVSIGKYPALGAVRGRVLD